ncbi:MAG: TonB family protein [Verrucomicrobiota bacterium]
MNFKIPSLLIAALSSIAWAEPASGETFTLSTGESYEGSIFKIFDDKVTIKNAAGEKFEIERKAFDKETRSAVKEWASAHPNRVDVYTKWDAMPVIKSTVMPQLPEQFHDSAFKGMVSVDLVLDQRGRVVHASIKKSTHVELERPSLEAAKTWLFEPAKVGGKAVKSKLRVPFKFTFVEKKPPVAQQS